MSFQPTHELSSLNPQELRSAIFEEAKLVDMQTEQLRCMIDNFTQNAQLPDTQKLQHIADNLMHSGMKVIETYGWNHQVPFGEVTSYIKDHIHRKSAFLPIAQEWASNPPEQGLESQPLFTYTEIYHQAFYALDKLLIEIYNRIQNPDTTFGDIYWYNRNRMNHVRHDLVGTYLVLSGKTQQP